MKKTGLMLVLVMVFFSTAYGANDKAYDHYEAVWSQFTLTCLQDTDSVVCNNEWSDASAVDVGLAGEITCVVTGVTEAESEVDIDLRGSVDGTKFHIIIEDMDENATWTDKTKMFKYVHAYVIDADDAAAVTITCITKP